MDKPTTRREQSHARIVEAAARSLRRDGYAGVGVADVMREAGLTHGGFYAHFPSRDALLIEALDHAGRTSAASIRARTEHLRPAGGTAFRALVEGYLSDHLLVHPEAGCPVAALCSEMPHQSPDVRAASGERVKSLIRHVSTVLPEGDSDAAAVVAATMIGALQIARAVGTVEAGRSVLEKTRADLLSRYDR